nr:augurin [Kogia breviceps]
MAASSARPAGVLTPALALLLPLCVGPGGISGSNLKPMLQKGEAPAPPTTPVAVPESRAKEFLAALPDDITYWLNRGRNGHDYYDYHRRHDDEDAAIGPRSPHGFRHGASVNYHDY